jgi:Glycosyltransferase
MRIVIAQSSFGREIESHEAASALADALKREDHVVEDLTLPEPATVSGRFSNLASFRLMDLSRQADALVCLTADSAILPHPRKVGWIVDDRQSVVTTDSMLEQCRQDFLRNIHIASLRECTALFVPSRFAERRLTALGLPRAKHLSLHARLDLPAVARNPGPELLCMAALDEFNRPELVIQTLKILPNSIRLRWLARLAAPDARSSLLVLAEREGLQHRLTIDVRETEQGERDYLLSQCLAYFHPSRGDWIIPDAVRRATQIGTPIIACRDAGAVSELFSDDDIKSLPQPRPKALAKAVLALSEKRGRATPASSKFQTNDHWTSFLDALAG